MNETFQFGLATIAITAIPAQKTLTDAVHHLLASSV